MEESSVKRVCINGSSGFVGQQLIPFLKENGYKVITIKREYLNNPKELAGLINGCEAVINLAGASIAGRRWTKKYRKTILQSRIETTANLVTAIGQCDIKPKLLISASAVGIYDSLNQHTEASVNFAGDFPAEVCKAWENESAKAIPYTSVAIMRFGIVLGSEGGVLKKLRPLFKSGLGGKIGNGKQPFPFVSIKDLCRAALFIIQQQKQGIYNLVSPEKADNKRFTKALAQSSRCPALFIIPGFLLKLLLGERADIFLKGQDVIPNRLTIEGFKFDEPEIETAIK